MLEEFGEELALWSAQEVACVTDASHKSLWSAFGVSSDLSKLVRGDLFISARGDVEAHKALSLGAAAVISETYTHPSLSLKVKNTLQAFIDLAQGARHRTNAVFIGVCGSDAEIIVTQSELAAQLSFYGLTYAPLIEDMSLKNIMLGLSNMPKEAEFVILPLPFEEASWLIKPDIVLMRDGYDEAISGDVFAGMTSKSVMICGNRQKNKEIYQAMAKTRGVTKQYDYFSRDGLNSACSMALVQALSAAQQLPPCPFLEEPIMAEEDHVSYILDLRPQRAANDMPKRFG